MTPDLPQPEAITKFNAVKDTLTFEELLDWKDYFFKRGYKEGISLVYEKLIEMDNLKNK